MEFPKKYTEEDVQAWEEWYAAQELPDSLQLSKSTYIADLKSTVKHLLEVAHLHWNNPTFSGYLIRLEEIKTKLEGGEVN